MITRRGLLQGILAAGMAPAIGRAGIIMPPRHVIAPRQEIVISGLTTISDFFNDHTCTIEEYMARQIGDRMALTREMIAHGTLKLKADERLNLNGAPVLRQVGHYGQLLKVSV